MGNMSYCRFQNTLNDLRDCERHIDETDEMSEEEQRARKSLIEICIRIADDYREDDDD